MGFKQNHLTCKYQNRENMCVFILYLLLSYKNYGIYTKVLNFYGWLHDYLWCSFVCKDIFLFKKRFTVNFTVLAQMHFKTNHKMSWVLSERRLLANSQSYCVMSEKKGWLISESIMKRKVVLFCDCFKVNNTQI